MMTSFDTQGVGGFSGPELDSVRCYKGTPHSSRYGNTGSSATRCALAAARPFSAGFGRGMARRYERARSSNRRMGRVVEQVGIASATRASPERRRSFKGDVPRLAKRPGEEDPPRTA